MYCISYYLFHIFHFCNTIYLQLFTFLPRSIIRGWPGGVTLVLGFGLLFCFFNRFHFCFNLLWGLFFFFWCFIPHILGHSRDWFGWFTTRLVLGYKMISILRVGGGNFTFNISFCFSTISELKSRLGKQNSLSSRVKGITSSLSSTAFRSNMDLSLHQISSLLIWSVLSWLQSFSDTRAMAKCLLIPGKLKSWFFKN